MLCFDIRQKILGIWWRRRGGSSVGLDSLVVPRTGHWCHGHSNLCLHHGDYHSIPKLSLYTSDSRPQTRMLVRTESIITQLVFDHALRIRMKSDVSSDTPASSRATTAAHTPDNASIAEDASGSTEDETVRASTVSAGSTVAPKKGKDGKGKKPKQ